MINGEPADDQDYVYSLTYGPHGSIYAARVSGLYRSPDAGLTWEYLYQPLMLDRPLPTTSVVFSGDRPTGNEVFAAIPGGLLCSTDCTTNWQFFPLPAPPPALTSLAISPTYLEDGILLAGTSEDGVFVSNSRGAVWHSWNFGLLDLNILCLAVSPNFGLDGTAFAGTSTGIFRSTNRGRAWQEIRLPIDFDAVLCLAICPDFAREPTIFAGLETHGLCRSHDGGRTWEIVGQATLEGPVNSLLLDPRYPLYPNLIAVAGGILATSGDGGESWIEAKWDGAQIEEVVAVLPVQGEPFGKSLWVGLTEGIIKRIEIEGF